MKSQLMLFINRYIRIYISTQPLRTSMIRHKVKFKLGFIGLNSIFLLQDWLVYQS